jgi:XTP/dITP diphosphohydrolase
MKLYFATTNEGKLKEAKEILGVEIEGTPLQIDEVQSLNFEEVASKKAMAYFERLNLPVFVDDASLAFNALNGLPGTYMGDFLKAVGNEGLIEFLANKSDRSAVARSTISYVNEKGEVQTFVGEIEGEITTEPRGTNGFGWDPIFIPKGFDKTFAEMSAEEKNQCSMRMIALIKFKEWLDRNPSD